MSFGVRNSKYHETQTALYWHFSFKRDHQLSSNFSIKRFLKHTWLFRIYMIHLTIIITDILLLNSAAHSQIVCTT